MKIDAYSALTILSVMVVLSYSYNWLSDKIKVPSVLLLIFSGLGLQYLSSHFGLRIPPTQTLLEILGVTGLIFIVLEAALDLKIEKAKYALIGRAFLSALGLLTITSILIAWIFMEYYGTEFRLALIHAIPLSVISSAIAIPSVNNMGTEKKEFVIYESTFSDILGIIAFNYVVSGDAIGMGMIGEFGLDLVFIFLLSVVSTAALVFLLNHVKTQARFFLTFAIIILTYSVSKTLHLPSLILVLCFGLVIGNFHQFNFPLVRLHLSFSKMNDVLKELKLMTAETAFIIRTFFFLVFGYSLNVDLLKSQEVFWMGVIIIVLTLILRSAFLRFILKISSTPLALIAPRGLITVLLFYSIPREMRIEELSDGVLFMVIVLTGLAMTIGLLLHRQPTGPSEQL